MRLPIAISFFLLCFGGVSAQDSATLPSAVDTSAVRPQGVSADSLGGSSGLSAATLRRLSDFPVRPEACRTYGGAAGGYVVAHPYFDWLGRPDFLVSKERRPPATDWLFYTLLASLALFGVLRQVFRRYLTDLSVAFFDLAIGQAALREQLARQTLPSGLMNLLFLFNAGLFIRLALPDLRWPDNGGSGHASVIGGAALLIALVYLGKHVLVRAAGWLAGRPAEAEGYLFLVMMVNKVAGIALIPMNLLLAYPGADHGTAVGVTAAGLLSILLLFRILRCHAYLSRELHLGLWPFLLSMASFEVMPILVIAKLAAGLIPGK